MPITPRAGALDPLSLFFLVHLLLRPTKHVVRLSFLQLRSELAALLFPLLLPLPSVVLGAGFYKGILRYEIKQESMNPCFPLWISSEEPTAAPSTTNTSALLQPSEMGSINPFSSYKTLALPNLTPHVWELNKNQEQIPQEAPHLTPVHCAHQLSSSYSNQLSVLIIFLWFW